MRVIIIIIIFLKISHEEWEWSVLYLNNFHYIGYDLDESEFICITIGTDTP